VAGVDSRELRRLRDSRHTVARDNGQEHGANRAGGEQLRHARERGLVMPEDAPKQRSPRKEDGERPRQAA
jgi:hypothetical protein